MIDIKQMPEKFDIQPAGEDKSFRTRSLAFAGLVALAVFAVWVVWFFASPTRTVTLSQGQSYRFGKQQITVETITTSFCPSSEDQNCKEWLKEKGATIRYIASSEGGIGFEYLGMNSRNTVEISGLKIRLIDVDPLSKKVKLSLTKI